MKKRPLKNGYQRLYVETLVEFLTEAMSNGRSADEFRRWAGAYARWKLADEARRK